LSDHIEAGERENKENQGERKERDGIKHPRPPQKNLVATLNIEQVDTKILFTF